ncbi:hypothetical protein PPERSA_12630 [Pseudocohnilembus persalinus]|uniref:Uncharacterized protein n=1 Tax=Pseudocohnilembus persalinus TaxID=266149 RepID=A0A0V0QCP5_PSEPJ|nr:hypothetical protein PPERSA_12630 [Pseudocohnilembus persalinus]|eukprot:KRW99954.1 hypothetical protein PPERSA_12630 [Pseudocohnilembus persalinus]
MTKEYIDQMIKQKSNLSYIGSGILMSQNNEQDNISSKKQLKFEPRQSSLTLQESQQDSQVQLKQYHMRKKRSNKRKKLIQILDSQRLSDISSSRSNQVLIDKTSEQITSIQQSYNMIQSPQNSQFFQQLIPINFQDCEQNNGNQEQFMLSLNQIVQNESQYFNNKDAQAKQYINCYDDRPSIFTPNYKNSLQNVQLEQIEQKKEQIVDFSKYEQSLQQNKSENFKQQNSSIFQQPYYLKNGIKEICLKKNPKNSKYVLSRSDYFDSFQQQNLKYNISYKITEKLEEQINTEQKIVSEQNEIKNEQN